MIDLPNKELILILKDLFLSGYKLNQAAAELNCSSSCLANRIKSACGKTPAELKHQIIMDYLEREENEGKTYVEISAETGIRLSYLYQLNWLENKKVKPILSVCAGRS